MQTIENNIENIAKKHWKYCSYLDFLIMIGLLLVNASFIFWKKKWQGFEIWYFHFLNFEIRAAL